MIKRILYESHVIVKLIFKVKYIESKELVNEINCKKHLTPNTVYGRRHSYKIINGHVS